MMLLNQTKKERYNSYLMFCKHFKEDVIIISDDKWYKHFSVLYYKFTKGE